jgi:hypothetical protein
VDPKITVRLSVFSDEAVEMGAHADRAGVTPTSVWMKGGPRVLPNGHVMPSPWDYSGWRIEVGPRHTVDLPGMLNELLAAVQPDRLSSAVSEAGFELVVSAHIYLANQSPVGTLEADLIGRLAALGAVLDIDLYVVGEHFAATDDEERTHREVPPDPEAGAAGSPDL